REIYDAQTFTTDEILNPYLRYAGWLAPYITDTALLLTRWIESGYSVLFEGAQGTMLDMDHGTYPFITSSSTTSGGAATGTGVPLQERAPHGLPRGGGDAARRRARVRRRVGVDVTHQPREERGGSTREGSALSGAPGGAHRGPALHGLDGRPA